MLPYKNPGALRHRGSRLAFLNHTQKIIKRQAKFELLFYFLIHDKFVKVFFLENLTDPVDLLVDVSPLRFLYAGIIPHQGMHGVRIKERLFINIF